MYLHVLKWRIAVHEGGGEKNQNWIFPLAHIFESDQIGQKENTRKKCDASFLAISYRKVRGNTITIFSRDKIATSWLQRVRVLYWRPVIDFRPPILATNSSQESKPPVSYIMGGLIKVRNIASKSSLPTRKKTNESRKHSLAFLKTESYCPRNEYLGLTMGWLTPGTEEKQRRQWSIFPLNSPFDMPDIPPCYKQAFGGLYSRLRKEKKKERILQFASRRHETDIKRQLCKYEMKNAFCSPLNLVRELFPRFDTLQCPAELFKVLYRETYFLNGDAKTSSDAELFV